MSTQEPSASPPYDGPGCDRGFVVEMVAVQQQAVHVSALARTHGAGVAVRALASRIARAQGEQAASLRRCLEDRDLVDSAPGTDAPRVRDLDRRRGATFDGRFLLLMQQHHRAALRRTGQELRDGQDPWARELARRMQLQMQGELATMEAMAPGGPLPR